MTMPLFIKFLLKKIYLLIICCLWAMFHAAIPDIGNPWETGQSRNWFLCERYFDYTAAGAGTL